jgi:hypothetical protein
MRAMTGAGSRLLIAAASMLATVLRTRSETMALFVAVAAEGLSARSW